MKKIISFMMTVILVATLSPQLIVSAMTANDGANWALARIGAKIDTDGYWGYQCKDFVNAYIQENWGFTPPGNAINLKDYNYPAGWQKIQNTPDFLPQPGDIAVWAYGSFSSYGHCGVITSANLSTFTSVDQNWVNANSETGSPAALVTHNYNGFWGVIRPPFDSPAPSIEAIHKDNNIHIRNGYFTFRNISSNKVMQVNSGADVNKQPIDMWDFDDSVDQRFNVVHKGDGKYKLYAECSSGGNNRVVDIFRNDGNIEEGQLVDLWTPDDDTAQLFYIWPVGNNEYVFEIAAKNGYVICPRDGSAANQNGYDKGSQLVVQRYTGAGHQKWKLCNNNGNETTPNVSYTSGSYTVDTNGYALTIRSGASKTNSIVGTVNDNVTLSVSQINGNWGYTSYNGINGWVCLDFTRYTVTADSISISKTPNKMSYYVGDRFDATGMEISVNYSNGQKEYIGAGFEINSDLNSAGEKTITVSYKGMNTTFNVNVTNPVADKISVYSTDIKKQYYVGESVDDEISVLVEYNNGSQNIINTGYTIDYDFSTAGTKKVTINYAGKTVSYDVTVIDIETASVSASVTQTAKFGDEIVFSVNLSNAKNVFDGNLNILYDNTVLKYKSYEIGKVLEAHNTVVNPTFAENKVRATFAGTSETISGNMLNIKFEVVSKAEVLTEIKLDNVNLYNDMGKSIDLSNSSLLSSCSIKEYTSEKVSAPTAGIASGSVTSGTKITLSSLTADAIIYYTLDGNVPTSSSAQYSGEIVINADTTIKAIAVKSGMEDSDVATFVYKLINENAPKIKIGSIKSMPGKNIDVTVELENNIGFASMGIEVGYNSDIMTLTKVTPNSGVGGTFTPAQNVAVNPFNMGWDSTSNISYNGNIATLSFMVKDNAPDGVYPITVDYYKGKNGTYIDGKNINYDEDFNAVGFVYVNGGVIVASYIPGDINGDSCVDNKDGTFLLRYLAGWNVSGIVEEALDIDGSGEVDNKDATILLRYLAGWTVELH